MKHIHFGRVKHNYAQWVLKECRCGMRRSIKTGNRGGGYSPRMPDWPKPEQGWTNEVHR